MNEFKKFDESIKQKLEEQEFPFDESNWEKASSMIDDDRQSKTRLGWIILCSVLFVGTAVLLFNYFGGEEKVAEKELISEKSSAKQENLINEKENIASTGSATEISKGSSAEISNGPAIGLKGNENETAIKKDASTGSATEIAMGPATVSEKNTAYNNKSKKENNSITKKETNTAVKSEIKSITPSTGLATNSENKNVSISKKNKIALKSESERASKKGKVLGQINKQKSNTSTGSVTETSTGSGQAGAVTETSKGSVSNQGKNTDGSISKIEEIRTSYPTVQETKDLSQSTSTVSAEILNPNISVTKSDSVSKTTVIQTPKTDSVKVSEEVTKKDEPKIYPDYKNILYFEAGADYLLGWNYQGKTEGNGFNPVFGINYTRFFIKNIGLSLGAQYNTLGNLTNGSHTVTVTHYDFGIEQNITIYTPTFIHYIVMPIKVNYKFKNNMLGLGCNVSFMFETESKVETYNTRLNYVSATKVSKETGFLDGFTAPDLQLSAFYRTKIYKNLGVNAEFIYGLSDLRNDAFISTNLFERKIGFRLTLTYDLFKK